MEETKRPSSPVSVSAVDLTRRESDNKTMRLLDDLAKLTGYPEGIYLSQVDEVLLKAANFIRAAQATSRSADPFEHGLTKIPPRPIYGPSPILTAFDFSLYLAELVEFTTDNRIPRDLPSRVRKAGEEFGELAEAAAHFCVAPQDTTRDDVRSEAADMITTGVDILLLTGGLGDVVPALIDNLRRKAEKYRRKANRPDREGRP